MKHKNIFLLLCLSAVIPALFTSCSKDDNPVTSVPLDTASFTYPVKDGNYWKYNLTVTYTDCHPDTIKKYLPDIHANAKVTVLYDTLINSVNTKCFLEQFSWDTIYREARYYYINTDTAFLLYAKNGFSSGFLPPNDKRGSFNILNPPQKILLYPVTTGKHWLIDTNINASKTYLGFENVNTPAGTISCMKTVRTYISGISPPVSYDYYDYYSSKGLIREHVFYDNMIVTTIEYPEGLGTADITGETILTGYSVNP